MFTLKSQVSRFGLLAGGLVMLTLFTTLGGLQHYRGELTDQLSKAQLSAKNVKQTLPEGAVSAGPAVLSQAVAGTAPIRSVAGQSSGGTGQPTASNAAQANQTSPSEQAATAAATVSANLTINGQPKGTVNLSAGSNQCDVLSQALADGLISYLDMSYNSNYGTEAVYVINNIGKPGVVQWTYTVNGKQPRLGCSYIPVHNGDSVSWKY